jgi:NADPH:quinone reductase-like Zn-dependent oxidoreductase
MKAIIFHEHGGVDQLRYTDFPTLKPASGECLVRVQSVALNGFDPMILNKTRIENSSTQ